MQDPKTKKPSPTHLLKPRQAQWPPYSAVSKLQTPRPPGPVPNLPSAESLRPRRFKMCSQTPNQPKRCRQRGGKGEIPQTPIPEPYSLNHEAETVSAKDARLRFRQVFGGSGSSKLYEFRPRTSSSTQSHPLKKTLPFPVVRKS